VALSLVVGPADPGMPHRIVDADLHPPLLQVAGVVTGAPRAEQATAFLDFVLSNEGQALLARYGFEPPPGTDP
jgi:molybdate transport system substrate-binding protein